MSNTKSAAICLALAWAFAVPADATTIIVTNTNDSGAGSLRQALANANDGDAIDATGISGAIILTSGELRVNASVTINGAGADVLAVDGNAAGRVFLITFGDTVTISGFTIRNANVGADGGGIDNEDGSTVTVINCTLSGNIAGLGGGIFNGGSLTIANSTLSGNMAGEGAGTYNDGSGTVTIINSTLSGNMAGTGSGSFNIGTMTITNTTFSDNPSSFGGVFNSGTVEIGDAILNMGASGANIVNKGGTVTSLGYNVSNDDGGGFLTGPGDQINTDPLLGPLQDNGGPTFTHELLAGSPAIDAGDPSFTPPPFYDQRGPAFDRVVNSRIDIGSFEVQGSTPTPTPTATATPTATSTATPTPSATVRRCPPRRSASHPTARTTAPLTGVNVTQK